jgi:norsolorinic acid ketoreductase
MNFFQVVADVGRLIGIGNGLAKGYASRSNTVVIAGVRDPASASSKALLDISRGDGSSVIVVKVDSTSETDPQEAVQQLKQKHNIDHLDIVIANAGIATTLDPVKDLPVQVLREHLEVNLVGPLLLLQATLPLLERSSSPKFVYVSTTLGSIGDIEHWPISAAGYGASKAAMNYFTRKIHFENQRLTSFAIHPG